MRLGEAPHLKALVRTYDTTSVKALNAAVGMPVYIRASHAYVCRVLSCS